MVNQNGIGIHLFEVFVILRIVTQVFPATQTIKLLNFFPDMLY